MFDSIHPHLSGPVALGPYTVTTVEDTGSLVRGHVGGEDAEGQ